MRSFIRIALAGLALAVASAGGAMAQHGHDPHKLSLGVQATGTVKWELAAMSALGLDRKHQLELDIRDVADSKAGQIALQAGEVDVILSDFVWVSLQRHGGNMVTMVPHSLTVGGLMVDPAAGITNGGLVISIITVLVLIVTGWLGNTLAYSYHLGAMDTPSADEATRAAEEDRLRELEQERARRR